MKNVVLFLLSCFVLSCTHTRYSQEIEAVLKQAGDNRKELEKVMEHYKNDSLKRKATEFLIVNMPGKYSEYYDVSWNDMATVCLRWSSSSDKQRILSAYKLGKPLVREDVKYITAEYLINNIDLAFKVWQQRPWGKHIDFDAFCEEILPYRINTEALENWREKALASFADLDTTLNKPERTSEQACRIINKVLPQFRIDKDFPYMTFSQSMASARGNCENMASLAIFSMRALGVPVTLDFTPRWIETPNGHAWNAVRDSASRHVSFVGTSTNPNEPHQGITGLKSKVYRKTFAIQNNIETEEKNIPPLLREHQNMKDVSDEYDNLSHSIAISLKYPAATPTGYVFLAFEHGYQWHPVAWATTGSDGMAHFTSIAGNILYLPVYFADNEQIPAGDPFWLDSTGKMQTLSCDSQDTLLNLGEVFRLQFIPRMQHGVFEGANKNDFSDAKILHEITDIPKPSYNEVTLKIPANYRYLRYKSPDGGFCNVAEIAFYDINNQKLTGKKIGTPYVWYRSQMTHDKAFDNDTTTYFDAVNPEGAWTGLDLHTQKRIAKIRYYPRTGHDDIVENNNYKLFCMTKDGWTSLGEQTAVTANNLQYQAPARGLFYLKNMTQNQRERIFFIKPNGSVYWRNPHR